jgi:hypothetical protein
MSYMVSGKFLLALIFVCGLLAFALPVRAQKRAQPLRENDDGPPQGRRIAPPSGLDCDRDHITSFTGRVLSYSRGGGQISIRVRTDEGTTESFTISYAQAKELLKRVKLNGQVLSQNELTKIEARWKREKRTVRATVWACYDKDWRNPKAVLIDWQIGKPKPPETL